MGIGAPKSKTTSAFAKGFGHSLGKNKRHSKIQRENILTAANKPTIRRLARRGGVRRISVHLYDETRKVLVERLKEIIGRAFLVADHCHRKTINTLDIVLVLNELGSSIYGFGEFCVEDRKY